MTRDIENNRNEQDSKRGDGKDNKHNVVGNRSPHLCCTLLHKHTSKREHWDKNTNKRSKKPLTHLQMRTLGKKTQTKHRKALAHLQV